MAVVARLDIGATAASDGTSRAMASASASLNGAAPELWPGPIRLPGLTISRLLPKLAICSVTLRVAPLPKVTRMITAATPMMMPSIVRIERMTFRRSSRSASNSAFPIIASIFPPRVVFRPSRSIRPGNAQFA